MNPLFTRFIWLENEHTLRRNIIADSQVIRNNILRALAQRRTHVLNHEMNLEQMDLLTQIIKPLSAIPWGQGSNLDNLDLSAIRVYLGLVQIDRAVSEWEQRLVLKRIFALKAFYGDP